MAIYNRRREMVDIRIVTAVGRMFSLIIGSSAQENDLLKCPVRDRWTSFMLRTPLISAIIFGLSACTGAEPPEIPTSQWYRYLPTTSDEIFVDVTPDNKIAIWSKKAYRVTVIGTRLTTEHMEARDPASGILSYRLDVEVDCISRTARFLDVSGYYERNLSGRNAATLSKPGEWEAMPSGSIRSKIMDRVCQL